MINVPAFCSHHRGYQGVSLPSDETCFTCWQLYFHHHKHEDAPVTGKVLLHFMAAIRADRDRHAAQTIAEIVARLESNYYE